MGQYQTLSEVQVDDLSRSSLIHQRCNSVAEGHQICQARFALSEPMLAVTNHLIFHVASHSFQEDLLHDLAGHRGETDCLHFLPVALH